MIRVGVLGYGYWGPNLVRNFHAQEQSEVVLVCDKSRQAGDRLRKAYPAIPFTTDENEILTSTKIDVVCVITPVASHHSLAKRALENGKHVFVEKPFTCNSAQAEELIELADRRNLKIMVDHTFLFTGAVRKIRQLVDEGALGRLFYYDALRVNLGLFQHDVSVIWDLAPNEKVKVYDKGVSLSDGQGLHKLLVSYRSGDMWSPQLEQVEALTEETAYFLQCILENRTPFNDGLNGLRIVRILEAADKSIRNRGEAVAF